MKLAGKPFFCSSKHASHLFHLIRSGPQVIDSFRVEAENLQVFLASCSLFLLAHNLHFAPVTFNLQPDHVADNISRIAKSLTSLLYRQFEMHDGSCAVELLIDPGFIIASGCEPS